MPETTLYTHIASDPEVCSGYPRIAGTRIRVLEIVALLRRGLTPEEMLDAYEFLTLAQIHAALAYYYDHVDEVERQFEESRRFEEEFRRDHPDLVHDA